MTDNEKVAEQLFIQDRRVEDTLAEVVAYTHGLGLVEGSHEAQYALVALIAGLPLYQMFNTNTVATIEEIIVTNSQQRDFILNLHSKFSTIMALRNANFSTGHLISKVENIYYDHFDMGSFNSNINKTLVKNLRDAIVPSKKEFTTEYLTKNRWYITVILINVFSISILKVMDDVKRPPVKSEGT